MNCPIDSRDPEMLVALCAGQLDLETAEALKEHLAACAACRSVAAEQSVLWKALEAWEAPAISPDFDRGIYRRIDEGAGLTWFARLKRSFREMPLRQALPLTATAGLLLMAGFLVQHPNIVAPAAQGQDSVRANQVERTLDDLDLLRQFSATGSSSEGAHPDAM